MYDLDPDVHGSFDFVFMGSLLLHLRDPAGALMAVRRVAGGELLSVDSVSPLLTLPPPPPARGQVRGAGLAALVGDEPGRLPPPFRGGRVHGRQRRQAVPGRHPRRIPSRSRGRAGRCTAALQEARARRGIPHAWVLAR